MILTIKAMPYPGSSLDRCKKEAGEISKSLKCSLTFNHNGQEYIADDEGNVAKSENKFAKEIGYE